MLRAGCGVRQAPSTTARKVDATADNPFARFAYRPCDDAGVDKMRPRDTAPRCSPHFSEAVS